LKLNKDKLNRYQKSTIQFINIWMILERRLLVMKRSHFHRISKILKEVD